MGSMMPPTGRIVHPNSPVTLYTWLSYNQTAGNQHPEEIIIQVCRSHPSYVCGDSWIVFWYNSLRGGGLLSIWCGMSWELPVDMWTCGQRIVVVETRHRLVLGESDCLFPSPQSQVCRRRRLVSNADYAPSMRGPTW